MTDTFQYNEPPKITPDQFDQFLDRKAGAASIRAIPQENDDPERAARAVELSKHTGIPPELVYSGGQGIEDQYRNQLTRQIIQQNKYMQDYIGSHPLASKVSADDWGNLDNVTKAFLKIGHQSDYQGWLERTRRALDAPLDRLLGTAVKAFPEGFGNETIGSWTESPSVMTPETKEFMKNHPDTFVALQTAMGLAGAPFEVGLRSLSGVIHSVVSSGAATYGAVTGDRESADKLGENIEQAIGDPALAASIPEIGPAIEMVTARLRGLKMYHDVGVEPPRGADPVIDHIKAEQAKKDVDAVMDVLKEAQSSATRERSPEMFRQFLAQHPEMEIGIDGEAVRKLYGETTPMPDDGLLGWVPGIEDQLLNTSVGGGDIHVPLADWLAHVEPDIAKELKDDIRVRKNGLTLNEAKDLPPLDEEAGLRKQEEAAQAVEKAEPISTMQVREGELRPEEIRASLERLLGARPTAEVPEPVAQAVEQARQRQVEVHTNAEWRRIGQEEGQRFATITAREHSRNGATTHITMNDGSWLYTYHDGETVPAVIGRRAFPGHVEAEMLAARAERGAFPPPEPPGRLREPGEMRSQTTTDWMLEAQRLHSDDPFFPPSTHAREWSTERPNRTAHIIDGAGRRLRSFHYGREITETHPAARAFPEAMEPDAQIPWGAYASDHELDLPGPHTPQGALARTRDGMRIIDKPYTGKVEVKEMDLGKAYRDADMHMFTLHDENGEQLAHITARLKDKELYVSGFWGDVALADPTRKGQYAETGAGILGHANIRNVARQLKAMYPEAERIGGFRISGVRGHTGRTGEISMKFSEESLADFLDQQFELRNRGVDGENWIDLGNGTMVQPTPVMRAGLEKIIGAVNKVFERMAPQLLRTHMVGQIEGAGAQYTIFRNALPFVMWATDSLTHPVINARHEIIHHLRAYGFIRPGEWDMLKRTVLSEGWLEKYQIRERYPDLGAGGMLEEAIAEGFGHWYQTEGGKYIQPTTAVGRVFQRIERLWHALRSAIQTALGREPDFNTLFHRIETGEVGRRPPKPLDPRALKPEDVAGETRTAMLKGAGADIRARLDEISRKQQREEPPKPPKIPKQMEMRQVTRLEDRDLFEKAAALGMTVKSYRQLLERIDARDEADVEWANKQNEKEVTQRLTKEWKAQEKELQKSVSQDIHNRPDIAAERFLREGMLYDEKVKGKPKLNSDLLTDAQKAVLPNDYHSPGGLHPDDVGNLFGFHSGGHLVDRLSELNAQRTQSGLRPKAFIKKVVDEEVARRMQREHGDLAQNILDETQEQALHMTQFDLLHEQTLQLATKHGFEMSLTKEDMQKMARSAFDETQAKHATPEEFMRTAYRAGELAERAILDEDPKAAFQQKQNQMLAYLKAREAKAFQKVQRKLARLSDKYYKRSPSGVMPEYTNFIHQIMMQHDIPVDRTKSDLATEIAQTGRGQTLAQFIESKNGETGALAVDDRLLNPADPMFQKPLSTMTTDEVRGLTFSMTMLDKASRAEKKVYREGAVEDRQTVLDKMYDQLETFKLKYPTLKEGKFPLLRKTIKQYMTTGILNAETWLNRWDRDNAFGVFNQWLTRPIMAAANRKDRLQREYAKIYQEIGPVKDGDRLVTSPLIDPQTITRQNDVGQPYTGFTRKNLMGMILNAGNDYNWDILTKGHNADAELTRKKMIALSTKEDWERAEKIGKMFNRAFEEAQDVYRSIYDVAPPKIELAPFEINFANGDKFKSDGWYYPIIRDQERTNLVRQARGEDLLKKDKGLFASIANGYTKRRTGKVDVLSLDETQMLSRLDQVLHDTAFRAEVIEAAKLIRDEGLRKTIRQRVGQNYVEMLDNWLSDVAGGANIDSGVMGSLTKMSNLARTNVISSLIGFGAGTVLKHGPTAAVNSMYEVGVRNFAKAFAATSPQYLIDAARIFTKDDAFKERQWKFALDSSEELQRRVKHWYETLGGSSKLVDGKPTLRDSIILWGSKPVAMSDMLSALPTWEAAYREEFAKNGIHGDAVFAGDRAVRRAHGSTATAALPELVRKAGPFGSWLTSLYGFFSTQMQRRAEIAFKVNDTWGLVKEGELKAAAKNVPGITALAFATLIWPTIVEEFVNDIGTDDRRAPLTRLFMASLGGVASSMLYFRDAVHGAVTGQEPSIGMATTPVHDFTNVFRDIGRGLHALDRQHAGKTVQDFLSAFGEATGMFPKPVARAVRYGMGLYAGTEKGEAPISGIMRGTEKPRKIR